MSAEYGDIYSAQCAQLRELAARAKFRIETTEENQKKSTSLDEQIKLNQDTVASMTAVMAKIKPWINDLEEYNAQKKKDALLAINSALSVASFVVPASMKGMRFCIEGREAWLENEDGMDADRLEGSGYKGTVSVYLRNVVLRANPDLLQFMLLDEPLSKLHVESAAIFSTYVPLLADNMQIIWIEHKKEVFANTPNKYVYTFHVNDEDFTTVIREE